MINEGLKDLIAPVPRPPNVAQAATLAHTCSSLPLHQGTCNILKTELNKYIIIIYRNQLM